MPKFIDLINKGDIFANIHPYKQKDVYELVTILKDKVELIVIFGSSVKDTCWQGSDLDVCIVSKEDIQLKNVIKNLNFLKYDTIEELAHLASYPLWCIEKEIWEKGEVVYVR